MLKTFLFAPIILLLGYAMIASSDFSAIAAGIAIFIVGMLFMEDGFRYFTGGVLARILRKSTDTVLKSIFSGFLATAIIQSSSLISVIAISFVTAELITLSQAIGIIFGANIGTTATAWIVATLGMNIKISAYAMPMLVFGVLFTFLKNSTARGIGNVLLGLGFIFLGISFMKDGFETLRSGIDLARFSVEGYPGIAIYVLVGAVATIIIQSSSATMALIITAVATGQIEYLNSLSLAIGANIGTTVTAILGALTSNENGRRLAVAHFIFNAVTAIFAIAFIHVLKDIVDVLCDVVGINSQNIALKLSLFHTVFNIIGVLLVMPFMAQLVRFLEKLFVYKGEKRGRPMYLDHEVVKTAGPALAALAKETMHLYDIASHTIVKALRLRKEDVFSTKDLRQVVEKVGGSEINIDAVYEQRIKRLYSAILHYAVVAEANMGKKERKHVYKIKLASREIAEAVKDIRELHKNIVRYMASDNMPIKGEYNFLRENLAEVLREIEKMRENPRDDDVTAGIAAVKKKNKNLDTIASKRLSVLLRDGRISEKMASSLMNDSSYTRMVSKNLLKCAAILWAGEAEKEDSPDTPVVSEVKMPTEVDVSKNSTSGINA
jgi:phosphate:Na+ symporter